MTSNALNTLIRTAVLIVIACSTAFAAPSSDTECEPGDWSNKSIAACTADADVRDRNLKVVVPSPDGKKQFIVEGVRWYVLSRDRRLTPSPDDEVLPTPSEMAWSPASDYFYIATGAGAANGYETTIFQVTEKGLVSLPDQTRALRSRFDRHQYCKNMPPNIAPLRWLSENTLLVLAQVPDRALCPNQARFEGYEVLLPDQRVVRTFTECEIQNKWSADFGITLSSDADLLNLSQHCTNRVNPKRKARKAAAK